MYPYHYQPHGQEASNSRRMIRLVNLMGSILVGGFAGIGVEAMESSPLLDWRRWDVVSDHG